LSLLTLRPPHRTSQLRDQHLQTQEQRVQRHVQRARMQEPQSQVHALHLCMQIEAPTTAWISREIHVSAIATAKAKSATARVSSATAVTADAIAGTSSSVEGTAGATARACFSDALACDAAALPSFAIATSSTPEWRASGAVSSRRNAAYSEVTTTFCAAGE